MLLFLYWIYQCAFLVLMSDWIWGMWAVKDAYRVTSLSCKSQLLCILYTMDFERLHCSPNWSWETPKDGCRSFKNHLAGWYWNCKKYFRTTCGTSIRTPSTRVCWKCFRSSHGMSIDFLLCHAPARIPRLMVGCVLALGRAAANPPRTVIDTATAVKILHQRSQCWWENRINFLPSVVLLPTYRVFSRFSWYFLVGATEQ